MIQTEGILPYKLEVHCSTFSETSRVGISETLLICYCQLSESVLEGLLALDVHIMLLRYGMLLQHLRTSML